MENRQNPSSLTLRRLLLLAATLVVGAVGWFLLGEGEAVIAEERVDPKGDQKVVARVNGMSITEDELLKAAAAELLKLERQKHETLQQFLENQVRENLLEMAAEKRGVSSEEYAKAEVTDKLAEIPQEQVDAFYEARKARIRQPKENVEKQIRDLLAREAMFERLKESGEVEILLEPFRVDVAALGPAKGPDKAPVTIVEFSDFECPYCGRVNPSLKSVQEKYGDKVRIVFRQFPLNFHPNAQKAGEASLCADEQNTDYFWKLHDAMFADQKNLGVPSLKEMAAAIDGLDSSAFNECLDSSRFASKVQEDVQDGAKVGVSGTPAFFVNGRFLSGAVPYETFAEIIDEELERTKGSS